MQHIALGLVSIVLRLFNGFQHRDDDLEIPVVDDGVGHLWVICQAFHTLDRTGQDLFALERFDQVQKVVTQFIGISGHRTLCVDGNDTLTATAWHPQFWGLHRISLVIIGRFALH